MPDASIVAPQGDVLEHGAARFFRRTGEGVYDIADLLARTEKMAGFVKAHKDAAPETPVYGFGYSNGANILASVMMAHPGLFARAGLLHPLIPWAPDPQPGLSGCRVLVTGGKRDPICPLSLTLRLAEWFEGQGAAVDRLMHPGGHELVPEELEALKALLLKA
jgi:phospholipase/carboxylesterase